MDKVNFSDREKLVPEDMNALHDLAEVALADLVRSVTGGSADVLFKNAPPTAIHVSPNIRIDVPEQWFAVSGVTEKVLAATINKPDIPDYHRIFFIISRVDQTGSRDFFQIVGGSVQVVTQTSVIRKNTAVRIEVLSSGNPAVAPGTPTLNPNDIGYIELASVVWNGTVISVAHNISALYAFPGASIAPTGHAPTHLPGGGDAIQLATLGSDPLGSTPGLVPSGAFAVLMAALQTLEISPQAKFLTKIISGTNSSIDPKKVELALKINQSLAGFFDSQTGQTLLGVNFAKGPYAGDSPLVASGNHRHPPSQSPVAVLIEHATVQASDLGTLISIPRFVGVSRIYTTQVFWAPPGKVSPPYPQIECGWDERTAGNFTGAKVHIISQDEVKLELGFKAITRMGQAALDYVLSTLPAPTPNWTYADAISEPTEGEMYVKVIGLR